MGRKLLPNRQRKWNHDAVAQKLLNPGKVVVSAITQNLFFTKARTMARATKRIWLERTRPRMISAHTLSDEAFLAKFNLDDVATFLKRNDVSSAK